MRNRFSCSLLALMILAPPGAVVAEEAAAPDSAVVEAVEAPPEIDKNLVQCRDNLTQLDEHAKAIGEVLGRRPKTRDDRDLMRLEAVERLSAMRGLLTDTSRRISKLDTLTGVADSVRAVASDHLRDVMKVETAALQTVSDRVETLRASRVDKPAQELGDIESLIASEIELQINIVEWIRETAILQEELIVDADWTWEPFDAFVTTLAESIAGRLKVAIQERNRLRDQISAAEKAGSDAAVVADRRLRLQAIMQKINSNVEGLGRLVRIFEYRSIEASKHREVLIESTGTVSDGILDPEVFMSLVAKGWKSATSWLSKTGPARLVQVLIIILFVVLFRLLARGLWWLYRITRRSSGSRLAQDMASRMVLPVGTIVGLFAGLWVMGADPTTLLTGLGVASVIIGLALQDTLGNLAAGFFILLYRPYDVDDAIKAGGEVGLVKAMGLANTTVVTFDNRRLYVPNRKIWSDVIENRSTEARRRVSTTLRISYDDDLDRILDIVRTFLAQHELVMDDPAPTVFVSDLGPYWIEVSVWPQARINDWWNLTICLQQDLLNLLRREGIQMPYKRQDIAVLPAPADSGELPKS